MRGVCLLFWVLIAAGAVAQDYRCQDDRGEYWSTTPCREGEAHPEGMRPDLQGVAPIDSESMLTAHKIDSQMACEQAVERLAVNDYRWTARGWTGGRWPSIAVTDDGKILLIGDAVEFQNGFGAWIRHRYGCTYDPETGAASARAVPGRR